MGEGLEDETCVLGMWGRLQGPRDGLQLAAASPTRMFCALSVAQ